MQSNDDAERQKIAASSEAAVARIQAQSAAEVLKMQAQASADAKRVEGQGLADYQKTLQPTLTPQVLRMREVEATKSLADSPNAKIVIGAAGARTLLDLRGG